MGINDNYWMKKAYQLALNAQEDEEIPVGAILINDNQQVLGQGHNQVRKQNDPTAHAEIIAIRQAALTINNYRLVNTTLYVTLEPCIMCAGSIVHARIKRLVFASRDMKAGACGSVFNLLGGLPLNHKVQTDEGNLQGLCSRLLTNYFVNKN